MCDMATVRKRVLGDGSTVYQVQVRLLGLSPVSKTFDRLSEARRWASEAEVALREGRSISARGRAATAGGSTKTVGDAIDRYLEEYLPHIAFSDRPNRVRQLAWWKERIGSLALAELRPATIAGERAKLLRSVKSSTVNRKVAALSHVLTVATRDWEWLAANPAFKLRRLKEPPGRIRHLSESELEALLRSCAKSENPRLEILILTALATGAREGELLALRWRDIDLRQGLIHFPHGKNEDPKTIPIVRSLAERLEHLAASKKSEKDLIFVTDTGAPNFPRAAWKTALRNAGIEDFRFHDLRHTAASYLAMSGASLREIQQVLGHRTPQMTARYSHLTNRHLREVGERMAAKFLEPAVLNAGSQVASPSPGSDAVVID